VFVLNGVCVCVCVRTLVHWYLFKTRKKVEKEKQSLGMVV